MPSEVILSYDSDQPVTFEAFDVFCSEYGLTYRPEVDGKNAFYVGEVEVLYGHSLTCRSSTLPVSVNPIRFGTYWMGEAIEEVLRLALLFWVEHGDQVNADPEFRAVIGQNLAALTA